MCFGGGESGQVSRESIREREKKEVVGGQDSKNHVLRWASKTLVLITTSLPVQGKTALWQAVSGGSGEVRKG